MDTCLKNAVNKLLKMFYFAHCSGSANANILKPDQTYTVRTRCVLTKQYFFKQVGGHRVIQLMMRELAYRHSASASKCLECLWSMMTRS